jgi:G3E family GTPase
MSKPLNNIPTNVITGFLGVGKTTAILNLLKQKPEHERWSVLVNEAGKVGVDGKVIENAGISVKQVPGGCMCCAAGLPMQVAVNQLLIETRPQRLLIEPSGMGHPGNILRTLAAKEYAGVLDLRACLCLIDPRNLQDERYLNSELFMDQIAVADFIVANKTDQCHQKDRDVFDHFVTSLKPAKQATGWVSHGEIKLEWLNLKHKGDNTKLFHIIKEMNSGFFHFSTVFTQDTVFNLDQILALINYLKGERIKAIVNTDQGVILINSVNGETSVSPFAMTDSYRLEIISLQALDSDILHRRLVECQL